MKVKTSVTLEEDLLQAIDKQSAEYGSRSSFLEMAARRLLDGLAKEGRGQSDLKIINRNHSKLNQQARDVLAYQDIL